MLGGAGRRGEGCHCCSGAQDIPPPLDSGEVLVKGRRGFSLSLWDSLGSGPSNQMPIPSREHAPHLQGMLTEARKGYRSGMWAGCEFSVSTGGWQGVHREGQRQDEDAELRVCRELEEHQPQLNHVALTQEPSFSRGIPCKGVNPTLAAGLCPVRKERKAQRSHFGCLTPFLGAWAFP